MSRRYVILLGVVALMMSVAPAVAATPGAGVYGATVDGFDRALDHRQLDPANRPAPDVDDVIQVFIQLDVPSVAEFVATQAEEGATVSSARQRIQRNAVLAQQARARAQLDQYIVSEESALQVGANGLRVNVKVGDIIAIRGIDGVKSVAKVTEHFRTNATSVPWIGTVNAWSFYGVTGQGQSVAIIDTGIDYYHANYGGSGDPDDFADDDPTIIERGTFPTAKVVGGYDFVGDDYDASGDEGSETPVPDPDPLDCNGHGTHVAGTAAGFGVKTDGATYPGPYDEDTYDTDFAIGPGVAPEADLYALKVFGCEGSTLVTSDAIEYALDPNGDGSIDDAVTQINMSLGASVGSPDDPSAIASNNAVMNGVDVIASAGNEGPAPYVLGSPGVAKYAISVAASIDGGVTAGATEINSPAEIAGLIESNEADFSAKLDDVGPVTGDVAVAAPFNACDPITNPADLDGKIALVTRGACRFDTKYTSVSATGAIAMVVINNSGGPPIVMAGDFDSPVIPAVMIGLADGTDILDAIAGGATVNLTLDSSIVIPKPELADALADFTSSGPAHFGSEFKPDLAAPGFSIVSADVGTGTGVSNSSGTSMAAPHVAGLAALVREKMPDISPMALKSMLQNAAIPAVVSGTSDEYRITLQGAGITQADRMLDLSGYTMPGGVSFGRLNPLAAGSYTETVWVHSMSSSAITYDITLGPIQTVAGVTVSAPDSVTVPGGGAASFDLTMTLDPSKMPADDGFFSQTESDGRITLTNQSDSDDTLNMAWMGTVDPASYVSGDALPGGVDFMNMAPSTGLIEGFTLNASGANVGGVVGAVGVRTNDFGDEVVEFGIAHTAPWNSLMSFETDIFLDVDQDGTADYVLVAADLGLLTGGDFAGQVVTALFNLTTGDFPLLYFALADNNDHVQVLTADIYGDFGFLPDGQTTFDYEAATFDLQTDALVGMAMGTVDLDAVLDGDTSTLSTSIAPNGSLIVGDLNPPMPTTLGGADTQGVGDAPATHPTLWLYANNQVPDQFQIVDVPIPEPVFEMDTVGAFDPDTATWVLRNKYGAETSFEFGAAGDQPFVGDWNCNGIDTVGVYRDGMVALRYTNDSGGANLTFMAGEPGDVALGGDFNGDGCGTVALHRPSTGEFFVWNSLPADGADAPAPDITYYFGDPGDKAVSGDFDGDGIDTFMLHRESTGFVYFRNSHTQGIADSQFYWGDPNDRVIAGDHGIVDGIDTPALFRPSNTVWYFRYTNTQGIADSQFTWGASDWLPVEGHFGLNGN